jgi:DNA-binding CsgD family transcriptional regulator
MLRTPWSSTCIVNGSCARRVPKKPRPTRAGASGVRSALGVALRISAAVRPADAVEILTEANATLEGSEARYERALTLIELGAVLRRRRERRAAREPLAAALEEAHRCGAAPLSERAMVELRAAGGRPRRVMRSGVDAMTPSEGRVAALARDGLTNVQIAQELFITPKTVEAHLGHAYRKLDISSRKQLAEALAADGDRVPSG